MDCMDAAHAMHGDTSSLPLQRKGVSVKSAASESRKMAAQLFRYFETYRAQVRGFERK